MEKSSKLSKSLQILYSKLMQGVDLNFQEVIWFIIKNLNKKYLGERNICLRGEFLSLSALVSIVLKKVNLPSAELLSLTDRSP